MSCGSWLSRRAGLTLLAALTSAWAVAQERPGPAVDDPHARMRELILEIERSLGSVDKHLSGIDASPKVGVESSISARIAAAREGSRRALEQIDLLLEIRHHPHASSGGT
jgi:hypothetical protein